MHERTIRRLLIVVVCVFGVATLWVVANRTAGGPSVAGSSPPRPIAPGSVSPQASPDGTRDASAAASSNHPDQERPPAPKPSHGDRHPPSQVPGVTVVQNTYHQLTLIWGAATDGTGVAYYTVTLNGIPAGETASRQMTINWFNDDMANDFVQVRAVDAAGNVSVRATAVMVTRPAPPTSDSPAPGPGPDPTQDQQPSNPAGDSGQQNDPEGGSDVQPPDQGATDDAPADEPTGADTPAPDAPDSSELPPESTNPSPTTRPSAATSTAPSASCRNTCTENIRKTSSPPKAGRRPIGAGDQVFGQLVVVHAPTRLVRMRTAGDEAPLTPLEAGVVGCR